MQEDFLAEREKIGDESVCTRDTIRYKRSRMDSEAGWS